MKSILKYTCYNILTVIGFNIIGFLLALIVNPNLNIDGLLDNLISLVILSVILTLIVFLVSLMTKKILIVISVAYIIYATGVCFFYNIAMEVADVVWDSFGNDFKLGYVLFYIMENFINNIPQIIWIAIYIIVQGFLSGALIRWAYLRSGS